MEPLLLIVVLAVLIGCGATYLSLRRIRRINNIQPLLGVVAPQEP